MNAFDVTIMVVDDDAFSMGVAKKVLSKDGYELMTAPSGYIALELLRKRIPDLLLLDIDMPQMDGFELLERIKKDSRLADIPVIFLTAVSNEDVEIRCFEAGAMDFIAKPFAADILRRRVERTLELNMLQKKFRHEAEVNTKLAAEKESQLERLSLQLVEALSGTVEAKDKYTNGHSSRVAKYAMEIVKRMGGDSQEQQHIYYIGLLHDVGKIGVPDEIINKPERLTEAEFEKMKEHAAIGSNILRHISEIPDISVGARWHHERFDGKGYPDGLKGKDIPYIARVIAVADAYDAMTSNRSYRSSLPQEYAKQEIIKGIGTQFDPDIARVMVQIIDEDVEYKFREVIKTTYNILLVDDDTVNLRMAEFALSKVG
ncbi:MAG: HD domain-containing phosphohydrolase, partial [Huintestinicola sp.]